MSNEERWLEMDARRALSDERQRTNPLSLSEELSLARELDRRDAEEKLKADDREIFGGPKG